MRHQFYKPALLLFFFFFPALAPGEPVQAPLPGDHTRVEQIISQIDSLKARLDRLKAEEELKLQELEKLITDIKAKIEEKEQEEELQKLLEEAKKLTAVEKKEEYGVGHRFSSGLRQQQRLNPNISVSGDFFGGISTSKKDFITEPSDVSYGNNGFHLRELSLSFIAPLDPFTRGKTFISFIEDEVVIEEAYLEWLNLPARMNLKVGIFNAEYGLLNRYHDHALPQFDRPKVLLDMFSSAPIGGLGLAGNFLLKPLFWSNSSTLDISFIRGGSGRSFTDQGKYNLLYVGNMTNFYELTRNTYVEWRLGGAVGHNDPAEDYLSYVGNLGFTLKWVPVGSSKYRTTDWKTEFLVGRREMPGGQIYSKGFYSSLQNKLNARWWVSGRVGYSELPYDNDQHQWDFTGCIDYWQSEFVFFRLQYQYSQRKFTDLISIPGPYPNDSSIIFQVCWAMGPHKHEAY
ncbi:MAG: hypothetical protein JXQ83_05235 [Candidatus Glassbacteria bacterium]|nr:hypothetical protein [Candidatus Glassbacteria bacterium]